MQVIYSGPNLKSFGGAARAHDFEHALRNHANDIHLPLPEWFDIRARWVTRKRRRCMSFHRLRMRDALEFLGVLDAPTVADPTVSKSAAAPRRRGRPLPSEGLLQPHHCAHCGLTTHNAATCPEGPGGFAERRSVDYHTGRTADRKTATALYTQKRQVSPTRRTTQRSRSTSTATLIQIIRATPLELVEHALAMGLLTDLTGTSCTMCGCTGSLGPLQYDATGSQQLTDRRE